MQQNRIDVYTDNEPSKFYGNIKKDNLTNLEKMHKEGIENARKKVLQSVKNIR